jgi:UDP-N-acetylmuramoyl-tripeptide--D-alanyl-D-alanine ligase
LMLLLLPIFKKKAKKPLLVFGSSKNADVMIHYQETNTHGIHFTVDEEEFSARVFGEFQPQIFAPAIILGKEMNVNMQDIKNAIAEYEPPAGRGRIFLGKNGSTLWDFSYNCSPSAASAALRSLADVPGFSRRIALLGNMNELGEHTHKEHKKIGSLAEKYADVIIFVGKESEAFTTGIHDKKKVRICTNAKKAAQFLQDMVQENDLILVKGSQNGVFLEEAVKMLLEKKENVARLCRQSKHWEKVRRMYFESHKV